MFNLKVVTAQAFILLVFAVASGNAEAGVCGGLFFSDTSAAAVDNACANANGVSLAQCSPQSTVGPCHDVADAAGISTANLSTWTDTTNGNPCNGVDEICFGRVILSPPTAPLPNGCDNSGPGGTVVCVPFDDPTETGDCADKTGNTFDQFCGNEQPCFALTCDLGCAVSNTGIDTSGSIITVFEYTYSGGACGTGSGSGSATDDVVAENLPDGTELQRETETTTTQSQTNPDGSVTTTTTTETLIQSTGTGTSGSGPGSGATAEEIGDELTEETPASTDYTGDMDGAFDQLNDDFDDAEDALADPNDFGNSTNTNIINSLLPTTGCTGSISIPLFNSGETLSITCSDTTELRSVLSWLLVIFAAFYIFHMITSRPT
ncbi:MAG: hypothetical protein [Inoviridae sp.]|nr:MAG: hypothetical protein [Inoviridae sp.]